LIELILQHNFNAMELKDIVHVSGKPGLFKIVAQGKTNLVIESLDSAKTRTSVSVSQRFSILDDIAMFTSGEDIKLREVLVKLNDKVKEGLPLPDPKSDDEAMRSFMETVLPEYDKERVHVSDIKKLVNWYILLKDDLDFEALRNASNEEDTDLKNDHHEKSNSIMANKHHVKADTKSKSSVNKTAINRKSV
jgi:hypothetical protein